MRDIARSANVSVGTVSRVLNRHDDVDAGLRERVEAVARQVGYELSARTRGAVQAKSRIVGLILLNHGSLSPAQSLLLAGVEERCSAAGYCLLFARHRPPAAGGLACELPGLFQTAGLADCFIVAGAIQSSLLATLDEWGTRYVALRNHLVECPPAAGSPKLRAWPQVGYDDTGGFFHAARYLAQLGHRHIWYIGDASRPWHGSRLRGFMQAIEDAKLDPRIHSVALSDDEFDNGHAAVSYILDQGWPITAILAESGQLALGAREALRHRRLEVPRDVSLIGFEYEAGRGHGSNLTSVSVDMVEVGRQLARAAIVRIEDTRNHGDSGRPAAGEVTIPAALIKRSTCRPLRQDAHMIL